MGPVGTENIRKPSVIAVADGSSERRALIARDLLSFYQVGLFGDARRALTELANISGVLMVIDQDVPPEGGIALLQRLREHPVLRTTPVVFIVDSDARQGAAVQAGADEVVTRPYKPSALLCAISCLSNRFVEAGWEGLPPVHKDALRKTVDAFNGISDLIEHGEELNYGSVTEACKPLVNAVSDHDFRAILAGVRDHDNYSYVHSMRVATFLSLFGYTIGLKGDDLLTLASGGLVHDIGKMSIPYDVLNKPGRLDQDELVVMRSHVDRTVAYLVDHSHVPHSVMTIAAQHHEKLNGNGYPKGLKNGQLNELARMASIVDVFGALTDRRVYKDPMSPEKALDIMVKEMGNELDQHLLELFRSMLLDAAVEQDA
ncbi:MAG: HD domain-containing phosphohydrolase [Actinomycetota bacterium]